MKVVSWSTTCLLFGMMAPWYAPPPPCPRPFPTATGVLWSWGSGRFGELGRGGVSPYSPSPSRVHLPLGLIVTQVSAGDHHVLAVRALLSSCARAT